MALYANSISLMKGVLCSKCVYRQPNKKRRVIEVNKYQFVDLSTVTLGLKEIGIYSNEQEGCLAYI